MLNSSPDFEEQNSFQIKHDEKLFSRLVSKKSSMANPSFRVYYGDVSGGVPFIWESSPGTPKHIFYDNSQLPPPLTPPPSSYYSNNNKCVNKKHSRSKILSTLLMKINHKQPHMPSSLSSSSSSSSSSLSTSSHSSTHSECKRRRLSSWGLSFDNKVDDCQPISDGSHTPGLCFGIGRNQSSGRRGRNSIAVVKKALLSIVGRT